MHQAVAVPITALVMLTVAALFVRGAVQAARADPGFTLERGVMIQCDVGVSRIRRMLAKVAAAQAQALTEAAGRS